MSDHPGTWIASPATIAVACVACGFTVEVPNDTWGEMYVLDFEERHANHADGSQA